MEGSVSQQDKMIVEAAAPFIRSLVALTIYLRFGGSVSSTYATADEFLRMLKQDMK